MHNDSAQASAEASLQKKVTALQTQLRHRTHQVRRLRSEKNVLMRAVLSLQRERRAAHTVSAAAAFPHSTQAFSAPRSSPNAEETAVEQSVLHARVATLEKLLARERLRRETDSREHASLLERMHFAPREASPCGDVSAAAGRAESTANHLTAPAQAHSGAEGGAENGLTKEVREANESEGSGETVSLPASHKAQGATRDDYLSRIEFRRRRLRNIILDVPEAEFGPLSRGASPKVCRTGIHSARRGISGSRANVTYLNGASAVKRSESFASNTVSGSPHCKVPLSAATANPNQLGLVVNPSEPRNRTWYVHQVLRLALTHCVRSTEATDTFVPGDFTTLDTDAHVSNLPPQSQSQGPSLSIKLQSPPSASPLPNANVSREESAVDHAAPHSGATCGVYSSTSCAAVQRAIEEVMHFHFCCRRNNPFMLSNFTRLSQLPKFYEENTDCDLLEAFAENSGQREQRTDCLRVTFHAPVLFSQVRSFLHMDIEGFRASLTPDSVWRQTISPGKSGTSLIYFGNYVMKSVKQSEFHFLKHHFLSNYAAFCERNPNTMLPRFYALISLTWIQTFRCKRYVLMQNVFSTSHYIHRIYDVKGSTVGRTTTLDEAPRTSFGALLLKDNDLPAQLIICGPVQRAQLLAQLRSDTMFLHSLHIVDYSCLIGVRSRIFSRKEGPSKTIVLKKRFGDVWTEHVDSAAIGVGAAEDMTDMMNNICIHACDGGLLSLPIYSAGDDTTAREDVYYIGIIDVLQVYTPAKRLESFAKGLWNDRRHISVVPPKEFAERLYNTVENIVV